MEPAAQRIEPKYRRLEPVDDEKDQDGDDDCVNLQKSTSNDSSVISHLSASYAASSKDESLTAYADWEDTYGADSVGRGCVGKRVAIAVVSPLLADTEELKIFLSREV